VVNGHSFILIRQMAALVRRALAEVCTVPVILVTNVLFFIILHPSSDSNTNNNKIPDSLLSSFKTGHFAILCKETYWLEFSATTSLTKIDKHVKVIKERARRSTILSTLTTFWLTGQFAK